MSSNAIREIARMMDKRAQQPQPVTINVAASGPTSTESSHNHDDRYYTEAEMASMTIDGGEWA